MKIIVAGTGYVGLVHAAVCSEYGHEVYAYDIDGPKIEDFASGRSERIEQHVNEPGLANIIRETIEAQTSNPKNVNQIGIRLMKFCNTWDLQKIADQAQAYAEPLNAKYEVMETL